MLRLCTFSLFLLLFMGCSQKKYFYEHIEDISQLSQDPNTYLQKNDTLQLPKQSTHDEEFNKRFFQPWNIEKLDTPVEEAMWGFGYANQNTFGQNYKKHLQDWYETLKTNANFEQYNTSLQKAIVVKNTNMRVLPTDKPIFLDPTEAGEGFPFDYNQNTAVYINTPIFISHFSLDKAWAYVTTSYAMGWIKTDHIAALDQQKRNLFENTRYAVAFKDNFPIYDEQNNFIEYIKLGTLFPIYKGKLLVASKEKGLEGRLLYTTSGYIYEKPLSFNKQNINTVMKELVNEPYGWGGLYQTRDCSSMTRDLFSVFGIFLERNSSGQKLAGEYISLEKLSNDEKKEKIIATAKPFLSILYMKGHVMLYVGEQNKEPIIFHQIWGIRTLQNNKEGRFVLGKTAFTTLEAGKELHNFDPSSSLLSRLEGIIQLN